MRATRRFGTRAFTLVELMIVVAIIGVLAALAIYGVRKHLASAKTSEAKASVGAISRSAASAYERETSASQIPGEGTGSAAASSAMCLKATAVPAAVPKAAKYQPNSKEGSDFETGDALTGWRCLRFSLTQPLYYQYNYNQQDSKVSAAPQGAIGFEAAAIGDIDNDGILSTFVRTGQVNTATGSLILATLVYVENELE